MKSFVIYGAGGHGKVIVETLKAAHLDFSAVIDDAKTTKLFDKKATTLKLFLKTNINAHKNYKIIIAIGDNKKREEIHKQLTQLEFELPTIIHPSACVAKSATIGKGVVVLANASIGADAKIGDGAIINTGSIIEHDCKVGAFSHIAPGAVLCGGVKIGKNTLIGARSVVIEGKSVGNSCLIGAGSVVIDSIDNNKKVVGNPAKRELTQQEA